MWSITLLADPAEAHGSTQFPPSRTFTCRFEDTTNQMCSAAWQANSQALYDWMEVNIGDAAGRHRELIPDGQLCSAGRSKYGAFDVPGQWPVTALQRDDDGLIDIAFQNTAPHQTAYYRVYITRDGFDATIDTLAWSDLELVLDSGPADRTDRFTTRTALPLRNQPAILYIVWQRSDSPEAFYACSDVTVSGNGSGPTPTRPPTTVTPSTSQATTTSTPGPSTTAGSTRATVTTSEVQPVPSSTMRQSTIASTSTTVQTPTTSTPSTATSTNSANPATATDADADADAVETTAGSSPASTTTSAVASTVGDASEAAPTSSTAGDAASENAEAVGSVGLLANDDSVILSTMASMDKVSAPVAYDTPQVGRSPLQWTLLAGVTVALMALGFALSASGRRVLSDLAAHRIQKRQATNVQRAHHPADRYPVMQIPRISKSDPR